MPWRLCAGLVSRLFSLLLYLPMRAEKPALLLLVRPFAIAMDPPKPLAAWLRRDPVGGGRRKKLRTGARGERRGKGGSDLPGCPPGCCSCPRGIAGGFRPTPLGHASYRCPRAVLSPPARSPSPGPLLPIPLLHTPTPLRRRLRDTQQCAHRPPSDGEKCYGMPLWEEER